MRNRRSPMRPSASRRSRVTPGVSSTSAIFRPTSRLKSVDLPPWGRPTMATVTLIEVLEQADRRGSVAGPGIRCRRGRVAGGCGSIDRRSGSTLGSPRDQLRRINLGPVAQFRRDHRVLENGLERRQGGVRVTRLELGQAERLAGGIAQRMTFYGEAADALTHGVGITAVDQEVARENQRQIPELRRALARRQRVIGRYRVCRIALLREEGRFAEAGERRIATRTFRLNLLERRDCPGGVAGFRELKRRIELVGGAGGAGFLPPSPALVGGNQQHHRCS